MQYTKNLETSYCATNLPHDDEYSVNMVKHTDNKQAINNYSNPTNRSINYINHHNHNNSKNNTTTPIKQTMNAPTLELVPNNRYEISKNIKPHSSILINYIIFE